jgi:anti-sigma regulatory factor (Ser/Thr protein kinase)/anti-anti-sigma regulatory factor
VILTAAIAPDLAEGVITVEFNGLLNVHSAPTARAILLKCLAQCPDAVLVDVSDLRVESRSRLTVFPAAVRTHGGPPVALVLFGADPVLTGMMRGGVLGETSVYPDSETARAAVASARAVGARRAVVRLAPELGAARRARALIAEVCSDWDVDHLCGPAGLVISELVSNAVQHAGTDMLVRVARRGDYLHISVRDGSPQPPWIGRTTDGGSPAERGRGLHLVDVYTTAWGSNVTADSKTVWATLRVTARPGRTPSG